MEHIAEILSWLTSFFYDRAQGLESRLQRYFPNYVEEQREPDAVDGDAGGGDWDGLNRVTRIHQR